MCIYIYIYIYIYTHCVYIIFSISLYIYTHVHLSPSHSLPLSLYICIYVYISTSLSLSIYIYIHMTRVRMDRRRCSHLPSLQREQTLYQLTCCLCNVNNRTISYQRIWGSYFGSLRIDFSRTACSDSKQSCRHQCSCQCQHQQ